MKRNLLIVTMLILGLVNAFGQKRYVCEGEEKDYSYFFVNKVTTGNVAGDVDAEKYNDQTVRIKNNGATGWVDVKYQDHNYETHHAKIYLYKNPNIEVEIPSNYTGGELVFAGGEDVKFRIRHTEDLLNFSYTNGYLGPYTLGCSFDEFSSSCSYNDAAYEIDIRMLSISGYENNPILKFYKDEGCDFEVEIPIHIINKPQRPNGQTEVYGDLEYTYSIPNYDPKATSYTWNIEPREAYISKTKVGNNLEVKWANYSGVAEITVIPNSETGSGHSSEPLRVEITPKPGAIIDITGASSICYSPDQRTFRYRAKMERFEDVDYIWSVTGTGVTYSFPYPRDKYVIDVTISSTTTNFTITSKANNGTNGDSFSKAVTVSNDIDIDFSDVLICSGQGEIEVEGIKPEGGIAWVDTYQQTDNLSYTDVIIRNGSQSLNGSLGDPVGTQGGYKWEYYVKFHSSSNIPSSNLFRRVKYLMDIGSGKDTEFEHLYFGIQHNQIAPNTNVSSTWESGKDPIKYSVAEYNTSGDKRYIELDVTHLAEELKNGKGLYFEMVDYPSGYITSNVSSYSRPFETIHYSKNTVNSNTPGASFPITYEINNGTCRAVKTQQINVSQKPNAGFTNESFCLEDLSIELDQGYANQSGTGYYKGDNVYGDYFDADDPGSYDITYVFNSNTGCSDEVTGQITVLDPPTFSLISVDEICSGNQVNVSIPSASNYSNIQWRYGRNQISNVSNITFTPELNYSGIYDIEVDVTDNNGCSNTIEKGIEINEKPSLSMNDLSVCNNTYVNYYPDNVNIGNGSSLSYRWSNGATTDNINILVNGNSTYSLTVTSVDGCTATDQMQITSLSLPTVSVNEETICNGDVATLSATPFVPDWTYEWNNGRRGNEISVSPTNLGTNQYEVWAIDQNGCRNSSETSVYVNALPSFTIEDQDACHGQETIINAPPGFRYYTWSNGTTGTRSLSITPFSSQRISCEVEDNNGCKNSSEMQLTVHNPEEFSLEDLNDEIFCYGTSALISGPDGFEEYRWNNGSNTQSIQFPIYAAGNYSLTTTDIYGCESEDDILIGVQQLPVVSINDETICHGNSVDLTASPNSYSDYQWSNGATGAINTVTPTTTRTYRLTVTDDLGCINEFSADVNVNPAPSFAIPDQSICKGESANISVNSSFISYEWSTGETASSITVVADESKEYSCEVMNSYGCTGSESMNLSVIEPAELNMQDKNACIGDIITLAAPTGFNSYRWSTGDESREIDVEADRTKNYTLEIIDMNNCSNEALFTVYANPKPNVEIDDIGVNEGDTREIFAPSGDYEYLWSNGSMSESITVSPNNDTEYWLRVTSLKGCSAEDTFNVFVYQLPEIEMIDKSICSGQELHLEAPDGYFSYKWVIGDETYEGKEINIEPTQNAIVNLEVTSETGGIGGTSFQVIVNNSPTITVKDTLICHGSPVNLITKAGYDKYVWSTGSELYHTTVSPESTTDYSLTVTDNSTGCESTKEITVSVDNPITDFTASYTAIKPGEPIQFVPDKINSDNTYYWDFGDNTDGHGPDIIHYYYNEGIYDVALEVTSMNECSRIMQKDNYIIVDEDLTAIDPSMTALGVKIFPVPVNSLINIDARDYSSADELEIKIYSASGELIDGFEIQSTHIYTYDMSSFSNGIYILQIKVNGILSSRKITKIE